MDGLFLQDSVFVRVMSRIADLILLNLIFLLTSVPIFTIGASVTAMYDVCFRWGTPREGKAISGYFRAFRENFRKSTVLWLLAVLWGGAAALCAGLCYSLSGPAHYLFILFAILLVLVVLIFSYAFPLLSRFENTVSATLKNAALLSLGYLPRSLIIGVLNVFPFLLLLTDLYHFLQAGFVWVILWFSAAAYGNSILMKIVFAPYLEEEKDDHT